MGLHQDIKAVCAEAAPVVRGAAEGHEWAIHDLHHRVADVVAVLCRYDGLVEVLEAKGIDVTVRSPMPRKHA